jgi:release factor glutamine methyltransferase
MAQNTGPDNWTLLKMVKWGTDYFQKKGIDSPRLTIELLLCKLLNIQRIEIYTNFEKPLLDEELIKLKSMIKRRINREPLQYILGSVNFCGVNLFVNSDVLIPRPETEFLIETLKLQYSKDDELEILDIGSGSGCIPIALSKYFHKATILSVDISEKAIAVAKENAKRSGAENVFFERLDILTEKINSEFDIVVSNPPYISKEEYRNLQPEIINFEPDFALTDHGDGLKFYQRYADIFDDIVKQRGKMYLEIGYGQKKEIANIFRMKDIHTDFLNDSLSIPRIAIAKR